MKQKNFLASSVFVIPTVFAAFKFSAISDAKYYGHESPMLWYAAATIVSAIVCLIFAKRSRMNNENFIGGVLLSVFSILVLIFFPLFAFVVLTAGGIYG